MRLKRFLRKFRYNPKRSFVFMFLFLSLVSLTVGYAFLTTTMNIDGVSKMLEARWDIHFENLEVTTGSVTATTDATITTPTSVTFAAQLENPGDFYEFTVDVVNEGTINAMIDSVNVLPILTTEQQEYLDYIVTYTNGVELAPRQRLDVNDSERILVRFLYKDGVDESVYPTEDQELTIQFEVIYIQADGTEEDVAACSSVVCEEGTYLPAGTCDCVPCEAGSSCPGGTYNYDPIETHGRSNCPKGSYSLSESDTCTLCPAGTYQDEEGQTVCKVCATGKTSSAGATTSCTSNCSNSSNVSSWTTPSWNGNGVSNSCKAASCNAGNRIDGNNCTACAKGTYAANANASANCTTCPAGSYQDATGQTVCKVCSAGKTSSAGATTSCTTNCSNSSGVYSWTTPTWNGSAVSNSCKAASCNAGNRINGNNCTACAKGTFYPSVNSTSSCTTCVAGSYQDATGQTVCKVCSAGKTSSAGTTASCTTNCAGYAGTSSWSTPTWNNNNTVSNVCRATACASGYSLASDNVCRQPYTVTFNYNKASWNTNTTRTCTPGSNGKCSVTAPGIAAAPGNNKSRTSFSTFFSIKGWNTNSSATTATYGSTASIEVSGNTTYYAIVTLARTSFTENGNRVYARTGAGTDYSATGMFYQNCVITVNNYQYNGGDDNVAYWFYVTSFTGGECRADSYWTSGQAICTNRWTTAYYFS